MERLLLFIKRPEQPLPPVAILLAWKYRSLRVIETAKLESRCKRTNESTLMNKESQDDRWQRQKEKKKSAAPFLSMPSSPPSQSYLDRGRKFFNVGHVRVGDETENRREASEKDGRISVVCFSIFSSCARRAPPLSPSAKWRVEGFLSQLPHFQPPPLRPGGQLNRRSPHASSSRRRATFRPLHATMQGSLSGVPLARRAASSPSVRGE